MTFVAAVVLLPLVTLLLAAGGGLVVQRLAGRRLPGALIVPLGLALMIVATQLPQVTPALAPLSPWVMVAACGAGLLFARAELRARRPDPWVAAAVVAVYAIAGAALLLAGRVAMTGYLVDGTVAIHLTAADHLVAHGRDFSTLEPSSLSLWLQGYYGQHLYPSGAPVLLGSLGRLIAVDLQWLYQPLVCVLLAVAALPLLAILRRLGAGRATAAAGAAIAASSALVLAYALTGAMKEIAAVALLMLLAALALDYGDHATDGARTTVPLAVTGAAGFAVIGLPFLGWLLPVLGLCLVIALSKIRSGALGRRRLAGQAGGFAGVLGILALPTLLGLGQAVFLARLLSDTNPGLAADPGNLLRPLKLEQTLGIWLAGEYRLDPATALPETYLLIGVAVVGLALGVVWLARRREFTVLAVLGAFGAALCVLTARGTEWLDAKLLVLTSPLVVLVTIIGALGLMRSGRRLEGALLGVAIGLGVLVSDGLLYHDTNLTPAARFAELADVARLTAGRGPTYLPDFDELALYVLRESAPEGPGFAFHTDRTRRLRDGRIPVLGVTYDADEIAWPKLRRFRLIVLRQGPHHSRPPTGYRRIHDGRFYAVWERRPVDVARTIEHRGAGTAAAPAGRPDCRAVRALAGRARAGEGVLLVALRRPALQVDPLRTRAGDRPAEWVALPRGIVVDGAGRLDQRFAVRRAGRYRVWLEGDFRRAMQISIDRVPAGRAADSTGGDQNMAGGADVRLGTGRHTLRLQRAGGGIGPGDGAPGRLVRTWLEPVGAQHAPRVWNPASWRGLCARHDVDWMELRRR